MLIWAIVPQGDIKERIYEGGQRRHRLIARLARLDRTTSSDP
jgi:hypothetical protein